MYINLENNLNEKISIDLIRFLRQMFPIFVSLAVVENGVRLLKGKSILRINDSMASLGQGVFQECLRYSFILIMKLLIFYYSLVFQ